MANETVTDVDIEAARRRGAQRLATEPLAVEVVYDLANDRVLVELDTGFLIGIPRHALQGLEEATPEQMRQVEILDPGTAISWDEPDVSFSVAGLAEGFYGTPRWMAELGRAGGLKRSEAKAAAARANGKKGGRPPRQVEQQLL